MSEKQPQENPFRELDELKNRLPFLWELHAQRPGDSDDGRPAVVEQIYARLMPKPAA